MTNIAVIYYSQTGTNHEMAKVVAKGAEDAGASVRIKRVVEAASSDAIASNESWKAHVNQVKDEPVAELGDLEWAHGVIFGTPTRYGGVSAQLKAFIDSTGPLWMQGKLANKVYAGFTSAQNTHGGQESTLLALYTAFYHFGGIIASPGYTDPLVFASGGNPYGPSVTSAQGITDADRDHAAYLGRRVAEVAGKLAG